MVADLVISEFMASPTSQPGNIADVDGAFSDWIEVHNTTNQPINLAGWQLRDSEETWTFPSQTLAANGYLVVFASDKNRSTAGQELHTNFKLGNSNDTLTLLLPDGVSIASDFDYPDQLSNISYGPNSALTANGYFHDALARPAQCDRAGRGPDQADRDQ
jgi:hypothetical protein